MVSSTVAYCLRNWEKSKSNVPRERKQKKNSKVFQFSYVQSVAVSDVVGITLFIRQDFKKRKEKKTIKKSQEK